MCELLRSVRPEYSDLYASEFEDKGLSYVEDIVHVDWKDLKNQIPKLKYFHFVFIKKKAKEIVEKEASHNYEHDHDKAEPNRTITAFDVIMERRPMLLRKEYMHRPSPTDIILNGCRIRAETRIKKKLFEMLRQRNLGVLKKELPILFFVFLDVLMFYRPIATVAKRETAGPHISRELLCTLELKSRVPGTPG